MRNQRIAVAVGLSLALLAGCTADNVGGDDVYVDPPGEQFWDISVLSATVAPTKPDGTSWRVDGSAPVPQVGLFIDDFNSPFLYTNEGEENQPFQTYSPSWSYGGAGPIVTMASDKLLVRIFDYVSDGDTPIISSSCTLNFEDTYHSETENFTTCSTPEGSVQVRINVTTVR